MLLYIIRHGDPDYTTDTLTERGILQAEAVGKRLYASGINRIFSSPKGRARMTAEPACRLLGLTAEIEDWTKEIEGDRLTPYPDGVMKTISRLPNYVFREAGGLDLDYDHAWESNGISESRMKEAAKFIEENGNRFLEKLGYKYENGNYRITNPNDEKVALFCHAAFARTWLSTLLHIPLHLMWAGFSYTHTGVTVIDFKNHESGITAPQCLCYSDISHFYAHGPDMQYRYVSSGIDI
jgi:probable phosphoglycerate mutase